MNIREIVDLYYEGWTAKRGDLTAVPFADGFVFQSPVAHIEGADAYPRVALEAGPAITKFDVPTCSSRGRWPAPSLTGRWRRYPPRSPQLSSSK
jgi:hypothetical protein